MYSILFLTLAGLTVVCQANWRIISGQDATQHEFPSIVSIKFGTYYTFHFCGGTLIDRRTVLTAAHCVYDYRHYSKEMFEEEAVVVVLGEHNQEKTTGKERIIKIERVTIPSAYKYGRSFIFGNDIALVHLSQDASEEGHIKFVELPAQDEEPSVPGETCVIAGWGSLEKAGEDTSDILQKANMKILSNDECSKTFRLVKDNPSNICTGNGISSTTSCRGDSGGPLFCKKGNGYVQVGVVSYGKVPCGQPNVPAVFTRVSNFRSWINQNL